MTQQIRVSEAVHNGARSLREDDQPVRAPDTALAARNLAVAQRLRHEKAETFWTEVLRFCKAKEANQHAEIIVVTG